MSNNALPTDEDRTLLRESLRGWLGEHWPAATATSDAAAPARLRAVWRGLAQQGLAALCCEPTEGGLQEVLLAAEELGRAACPAPLLAASLLNLAGLPDDAPVLAAMRAGEAFIAFSFAQADGDATAGQVELRGERLSGHVAFVECGAAATHLAVVTPGPQLALIELAAEAGGRIVREDLSALGQEALSTFRFDDVPAMLRPLSAAQLAALRAASRLGHVGRAVGAATRAFEMAVAYAGERR